MRSLEDLFHTLLQDVYFSERHMLKSLATLCGASANPLLRNAFDLHRFETLQQVTRLEHVFELIGRRPRGRYCAAIVAMLAEAEDLIQRSAPGHVRDAGMLSAARAVEHYEIARYATLAAWAERFHEHQAARLLQQSLEEERGADALLEQVAAAGGNHAVQAA